MSEVRIRKPHPVKVAAAYLLTVPFATALRRALGGGYGPAALRADLLAGLTVGIVAVPLAMALAIGSGVPPQYGLYTAIVAGIVIALCGGSRFSVSGPTAAFIVILHPIAVQYGVGGLVLATLMAGVILLLMGVARMGRLIQFIPYPVTTGFTSGIAVVIATLQFKDFLGLELAHQPDHFIERMGAVVMALPTAHLPDLLVGVATLGVLLLWPRLKTGLPPHLPALLIGTLGALGLNALGAGEAATIASRFSYQLDGQTLAGIPAILPQPVLPWQLPGPDGLPLGLSFGLFQSLLGPALAIAVLGAIESLLCAVVADGMTGTKHDPDAELVGQGLGNLLVPFFGGIAATGALARTAANIRSGARTPLASVFHALFILLVLLVLGPWLAWLPMASLAALLLMVAWNMSELKHFRHILKVAPASDVLVLLACFGLTVIFDMVMAVGVGVVLAAFLFMGRMAALTGTKLMAPGHPHLEAELPEGVQLYEVAGPLFFGAAEKAMHALHRIDGRLRVLIIDLSDVPAMDVTGLVALQSAIRSLHEDDTAVVLTGIQPQPAQVLHKAGVREVPGRLLLAPGLDQALERTRQLLGQVPLRRPITDAIT